MNKFLTLFILSLTCLTLLFGCGGSSSSDESPESNDSGYLKLTSMKINGTEQLADLLAVGDFSDMAYLFESDSVIPDELEDQGMQYKIVRINGDDTWYICEDLAHSATPEPYQLSPELRITFDGSASIDPDFVGTMTIDANANSVTITGNGQGAGDTYSGFDTVYTGTDLQFVYESMAEITPVNDCSKFDVLSGI